MIGTQTFFFQPVHVQKPMSQQGIYIWAWPGLKVGRVHIQFQEYIGKDIECTHGLLLCVLLGFFDNHCIEFPDIFFYFSTS